MVSERRFFRRWWVSALLLAVMHVASPPPAYAWFGWLDNLSGPGPFKGGEFDFKLVCFVDTPRWTDAAGATVAAYSIVAGRKSTLQSGGRLTAELAGVERGAQLQTWTNRIANPGPGNGREAEMLNVANEVARLRAAILAAVPAGSENEAVDALARAERLWRGATQPRIAVMPGSVAWASCLDNPKNSPVAATAVRHGDRRPAPALVINYRELYTNWNRSTNTIFAPGSRIALRVVEPKLSWPLTGSYDFLDGQAGIGRFWFTSDGFATQSGWIVEPVRLDLHFPAKFADGRSWFPRTLLAFSYSAGLVVFPSGFQAGAFGVQSPALPGSEAIFEQGIVVDVGRLLR